MPQIYGPPNVVAGLIAFYVLHGVDARSRVPLERTPGMVRVSRIGGFPENPQQDHARLLVEVWEGDQEDSFNAARHLWGLVGAIEDQEALPGLVTHHIEPATMPSQFQDDDAPELDRHQFEIDAYVRMEPMEVA
ncbi:hypothetical protein Bra3105_06775 [Brachybacterium halotolerans subsp. kimchii]|uniref:hypothetical protein n=1 Tax=Brachybacterium halotolerans TaxID=2795215 RepID=UPI001E3190F2|nr:hypothetical protein [Brachybacterium halotolerans]UEJ84011.1 hypothetical protein Bra3105_06775 [Brachybacterium halotolerans subsp. kimchii]